jgi:hypothetical protein
MIQHVEEIGVEAKLDLLPDWDGLEQRGIQPPLPDYSEHLRVGCGDPSPAEDRRQTKLARRPPG